MEDNTTKMEATALTTSESTTPNNIDLPKLENEIKDYLNQVNQNYIDIANNTIEIGKRLILAKSLNLLSNTVNGKLGSKTAFSLVRTLLVGSCKSPDVLESLRRRRL